MLLSGLSLAILVDLDLFVPLTVESHLAPQIHSDGLDIGMVVDKNSIKTLGPLMSVPYLVWLIVKYVSLEFYLSN